MLSWRENVDNNHFEEIDLQIKGFHVLREGHVLLVALSRGGRRLSKSLRTPG